MRGILKYVRGARMSKERLAKYYMTIIEGMFKRLSESEDRAEIKELQFLLLHMPKRFARIHSRVEGSCD